VRRPQSALILFSFATGIGLLLFVYRYLESLAGGGHRVALDPLVTELTGAWSLATLFPLVRSLARRLRLDERGFLRRVPLHVAGVVGFGVAATSLMSASRSLLFPLLGLGAYDYGRMPHRYFMEFPVQLIVYALMLSAVYVVDRLSKERAKQERTARLESELAKAHLENLKLRLQPHFLFNALNTISCAVHEDPAAADEMLSHLGELLRHSLRPERGQEIRLKEELAELRHYLHLLEARFGDDLTVRVDAPADTLDLLVPSLVLQPLIENAVTHGRAAGTGECHIEVRARREADSLALVVQEQSAAPPAPQPPNGSDPLAVIRERLSLLYGGAHSFAAGPRQQGGFEVALHVPLRSAAGSSSAERPH
jgi:two-component system, LytTR family, sensor kinase